MSIAPKIRPEALSAAIALFIVVALNGTLWSKLHGVINPSTFTDWTFLASFFVFQVATYFFFLRALSLPYVLKIVASLMVITAAAASYFMGEYGTVIDMNMIRNVFQTDPAEARDLTTWAMVAWVGGLGLAPALAVGLVRLEWPAWKPLLRANLRGCALALAVVLVNFAAFSNDYFSVLREQQAIVFTSTPANVVIAGGKLAVRSARHYSGPLTPIGLDAQRESAPGGNARPLVTILVVGETARAENFSLFGYQRDTNPGLKSIPDLVAFPQVSSCGTDTGVSVPCMFSGLGRARYSLRAVQRSENLLDLVQRTGLDVTWMDNQGGCKGVCARVPTVTLTESNNPRFCADGECHDEILLEGLEQRIASMTKGGVIVLHMMGSHGPAYFKRVPAAFARFKPVCETAQFSRCTNEEIVNAYDNTILYSDHVLTSLVALLRKTAGSGADTMMLYVSDHGESLGENGVYLHAMPYMIAPKQQTHVPMVMWLSPGARESLNVENACLADLARAKAFSHDNLFHTVLGLHRIRTSVYDAGLDILNPCRIQRPT